MSNDKILSDEVREFTREKTVDRNNTASVLNERRILSEPLSDTEARRQMFAYSRRSFLVGGESARARQDERERRERSARQPPQPGFIPRHCGEAPG